MKPFVIIVSGLSGAGKTVTLRALEDSGYFCVDNLPPSLIDEFINITTENPEVEKIGIGIDIREKSLLENVDALFRSTREKYNLHVIYLVSEPDDLIRRYKETRRPHPLSQLTKGNILKAIEMEKKLLEPLRTEADKIIDTSSYTPHQLRDLICSSFGTITVNKLKVTLISFGFKYGVPQNPDMLLDVRFLPNPHFVPDLRDLTGLDEPVAKYVLEKEKTKEYLIKIEDIMDFLIPEYANEGKTYLTLGVGCTGGRHRSPAITEKIKTIVEKHDVGVEVIHREI